MKKFSFGLTACMVAACLCGCVATGDVYRSDVYSTRLVNQAQEVQPVEIIAVLPARVAVENDEGRAAAQTAGAIIGALVGIAAGNQSNRWDRSGNRVMGGLGGAVAGGMIGNALSGERTLVDGVQITFRQGNRVLQSSQVGRVCEYKVGTAIMVSPAPNVTRIQPNNPYGCPKPVQAQ